MMSSPLTWLRTATHRRAASGRLLGAFWERWTNAVRDAVNDQEDEVFRDIQLRITQARHAFEDRFVGLPRRSRSGR